MARFILGHRLRALGDRHGALARVLYRLDHAFFAAMLWLIRCLPVDRASRFGAWLGAELGPRFRKGRALDENLQVALPALGPERRAAIVREAWANAGAVFAEYAHLDAISRPGGGRLEVCVQGQFATLRDPSRPSVFVTAHQANWEIAGAAVISLGIPLAVVYSPPTNPFLDELLGHWRTRLGCELLARDESMRPMIRALDRGRSLGIVMDRRVDSGKPVALFGHDKPTTLIPARLALRYGCEVVPIRIERLAGARFRATFHPAIPAPPQGDEIQRALAMTASIHALFEQWIRERPGEWFPSKRLWPKDVYRALADGHVTGEPRAA
jgi:KDO2-lipid IV(A) lauroyltransferase